MRHRLMALVLPLAAGLAFLVWAGTAFAGTTQISGSFPNGGCGSTHAVTVSGPSRIDTSVSTTSASNRYRVEIVDSSGNILSASGSYDTKSGGTFGVRVCSPGDLQDPRTMQYSGEIGTGPAGQPALPQQRAEISQGGVLGTTTTIKSMIRGHGAIRTRTGLAWVTVRADDAGHVRVRIDSVGSRVHMLFTSGMRAVFGSSTVHITGHGLRLVVATGAHERIAIKSRHLRASGRVVRGKFELSV